MSEKPSLDFEKPKYTYDELEAQLQAYQPDPDRYPHDVPSIISIAQDIRAGRMGNVAVGGCLLKGDDVILEDISKALSPYHRTDLHVEMVLLNVLEDRLCDNPTPRMCDYTLFTSQEPCPICLARICFNQVGKTYYVYRDGSSPEAGFDLIARGIGNFNIVRLDQGGDAWGLGDSITQFFFKPNLSGNWKFGIGPQFSLRTRTNENTGGPSWGAGPAIVVLGTEGAWTLGGVAGQLWSFDGDSSGLTIQPLIYYNFESMPGFSIGYDPIITADWKAKGGDQWTVPLGLTAGQLFDLGDGYALNVFVGAYGVPIRPKNGPQWQARLQLFLILPR